MAKSNLDRIKESIKRKKQSAKNSFNEEHTEAGMNEVIISKKETKKDKESMEIKKATEKDNLEILNEFKLEKTLEEIIEEINVPAVDPKTLTEDMHKLAYAHYRMTEHKKSVKEIKLELASKEEVKDIAKRCGYRYKSKKAGYIKSDEIKEKQTTNKAQTTQMLTEEEIISLKELLAHKDAFIKMATQNDTRTLKPKKNVEVMALETFKQGRRDVKRDSFKKSELKKIMETVAETLKVGYSDKRIIRLKNYLCYVHLNMIMLGYDLTLERLTEIFTEVSPSLELKFSDGRDQKSFVKVRDLSGKESNKVYLELG